MAERLRSQVLNDGLRLAMEWGEYFLRPIQERLSKLYPELSKEQLDEYETICRAAMEYGHGQMYELAEKSDDSTDREEFRLILALRYPWLDPENVAKLFDQGMYHASRDGYPGASRRELERLSRLSASDLMQRIERREFDMYGQTFAALATRKNDLRLVAPFLAAQLDRPLTVDQRRNCAIALLSALPYSGIPADALANPSHPGHTLYREDLMAHIEATLKRLA
ncbi:MAG TPA: hypothetical protein VF179_20835 [Thermoanaerobaculia bacterium]|nr:hypothetical protein [Thermoanaerobaculia bacterium]